MLINNKICVECPRCKQTLMVNADLAISALIATGHGDVANGVREIIADSMLGNTDQSTIIVCLNCAIVALLHHGPSWLQMLPRE